MLNERKQQEANEKLQREKELARIKISREDVDLIVRKRLFCSIATWKKFCKLMFLITNANGNANYRF